MTTQPAETSQFECKHALYFPIQDGSENDLVLIKEYEHTVDGRQIPRLKKIYNFERPFWVTRKAYRNHEEKKEWEDVDRLQKYECTEIKLANAAARALGRAPGPRNRLRELARSPYLYGTDLSTGSLIKQKYRKTYPNAVSPNRVACFDTETDMIHGHQEIILASLTFKDKCLLVVVDQFMEGVADAENRIRRKFTELLGDLEKSRNIKLEIAFVPNSGAAAAKIFEKAHEWQPDIVAIWNIDFDIPKVIMCLERYGYNLAEVFSDPSIPQPFKQFEYVRGPTQKVTQSGKTMTLDWEERWHRVVAPASFYILDAACVYYRIRQAKGKQQSMALDAILQKNLGIRKLKFEEAEHVTKGAWHEFMQRNFKIEYAIYNLFDCISMELLDEKTTDLSQQITSLLGSSEYASFKSQPKRLWDAIQFFVMERGKIGASTSDKMEHDLDKFVVGLKDWILTLSSHLVEEDGAELFDDLPGLLSFVRDENMDLDIVGTYPTTEILANISKETTSRELVDIEGVSDVMRRAIGVNLTGGDVNALEICVAGLGAPTFDQVLAAYDESVAV